MTGRTRFGFFRARSNAAHKLTPHVAEPRLPDVLEMNEIFSKGIFALCARIAPKNHALLVLLQNNLLFNNIL